MLWATRRGCHVDRTACVWLIRRFVDAEAAFSFFEDPVEAPEGSELFDVAGARFSHRGDDCSFETFIKEIISKMRRWPRSRRSCTTLTSWTKGTAVPSPGLDAIIRGMQAGSPRRPYAHRVYRRRLRRALRLPEPGGALASGRSA